MQTQWPALLACINQTNYAALPKCELEFSRKQPERNSSFYAFGVFRQLFLASILFLLLKQIQFDQQHLVR